MEKFRFVCATRYSSEEFFAKAALGRSLQHYKRYPKHPIELRLFQRNSSGLPSVYNVAIEESRTDPAVLVFIHDDVQMCDFHWARHLSEALEAFDIVGLAGNRQRAPRQCSWMYLDEHWTRDADENLSGVIGHGDSFSNLRELSVYGPPGQEVKMLDGVMMAVRSSLLIEKQLRFDPMFDFHFYDLDFCRQAEARQIRMGTWPISVIHESIGRLGPEAWRTAYRKYLDKYGE